VTNSASVPATQQVRTVNIVDTTAPVITRNGPAVVTVAVNSSYVDAGATALDSCEGNLTSAIVVGGLPIDTSAPGSFTVTYDVQDSSGNNAVQVTRTVNVTADTTPPVITLNGANPMNVNCGAGYTEPGYTAFDNVDGDITANVIVTGDTIVATTPPGSYSIIYTVQDAASNVGQVIRTVNVLNNCPLAVNILNGLNRNVDPGQNVTFDGQVTGAIGSTSLQWYFDNGQKSPQPISGANSEDLTLTNVDENDEGIYYLEASDAVTTAQSPNINFTVGTQIPAVGLLGLSALTAATALGGALGLRRRKKE
jgi:hypothetical protein